MPIVELKLSLKTGKLELDFQGFPGNACDYEQQNIMETLKKHLKLEPTTETRKDSELLQQETQYA